MTGLTSPSWARVDGPLAPYAGGFRAELERLGYTPLTAATHVRLMAHLSRWLAQEGVEAPGLTAGEVAAFVVAQSRQRPRSVKRMVTALRSLLGFLHAEGLIGQPLAVPSPAGWTQAGLPKALDGDQVAALLASCDPRTRTGRRDLAILTLLARLGLRAGEVAALRLDDIDWRLGEITVPGQGNRHDRLPLPADAGQRIVAYLQDGRPGTAQGRTVFVRAQAPYRALTSNAVTTVVAYAGKRAGLGVIGAHRLRHPAATA